MTPVEASREFMLSAGRMPALFDLAESELQLLSDLEAVYGEPVDQSDPEALARHEAAVQALAEQFIGNEAMVVRKIEGYIGLMAHLRMLTDARKTQAKRMAAKAEVTEKGEAYLKERLLQAMQLMGRERIETPIGTVRIQANPPRCEVLEEEMIPRDYKRTVVTTTINKRAILEAASRGETVPGTEVVRG